ncbi:hypothetical protein QTP88_029231 [Uroleucon formosanum]
MDNEQRQSILEICEHYQDIFYLTGDTLTCTDTLTHKINIPENQEPIYKRPYRLPHAQMAEIDSQIKQMEKDDIIEPSFSPWNAPLLLVKKKLDASQIPKFRIVVDFRALNKVTINEYHPLPNITEILDQLGQCNLFSIIDLASGFYQIKLDEKSKELTAFSTNQGHWHFKKMAMGLKTSPCSFQRLMNNVMAGIVGIKCLVYLDDIIIYGKGLLDHNEKLRDVFERLRNHNLKIQPTKCEFLKQQCMYLGHIISENGIRPDPEKIKSVLQFPIPTSVKEIKSFLGLSGYYRKFIKSYSLISKPMTNLLRKDVTFNWDTSCQEAFDKLKNILCSEPILQYPDFTKPFIVTTDASGKALGAILSQGEISQDLPIAYASRTLSKCESNYSTTELECLAIIFAVKTFRPYLYGRKFIILSDHRALSWLFNLKDPLSKLARWRILLEEYDYEIKYKPGVLNSNVDALSRMYTIHEIKEESYPAFLNKFETQLITNKRVKEVNGSLIESPEEYHIVSEIEKHYNFMSGVNYEIKQKFGNGQKLAPSKEIGEVNYLRDKDRYIIFLTTKSRNKQKATYENIYLSLLNLKLLCEKHSLNKLAMNKLGFIDQLEWTQVRAMIRYVFRNTDIDVIICSKLEFTDEEKLMIFKQCHDSIIGGHVGIHRTIKKIKTQFNWRGLKEDVIEYIKNCESCQKGKVANKKVKQPMLITSTSSEPFEKIFLDIVGPLVTTLSGNTYILTLQDDLTKYSMGIALPNHQANTIAEAFVTNFVCTHGIPQTILTDQGTDFLSKIFTEVCKLLQINKINTSPFHPQTNGSLERSHRTLTEYLRHYVDKKLNNWDEYLPYAFFVYNSTEHTSTGYQPYSLLYGRRLEIPIKLSHEPEPRYNYDNYYFDLKQKMQESHKIAKENLIKRKVKSKQIYDNNENSIEIHVKDQILLRDKTQKNKLNPLWIGPYEMALAQTKPYRISRLTQENGMYFENQGPLRLTNSDWKLLIYVKLDNFNQRTKDTMNFYKRTLITCNDLTIAYEGMFKTTCDNFKLTSNSLEREVSRKRFYMLQSIDETDTVSREKRGLVNLVGRVQKTLFGTLDDTDAELYDRQIEKLQSSQQNLLKIIDKQTSVLKATANTFKEANKMEAQINRLSVLYNRMADTVNQTIIHLDIVEARTNINEQINILNLLFQQLSFETDTICEIIIAAQGGIMHSSVIAVNELRQQLKDISLIVPKEQSLPFNLNQVSLYELSKISKFNIIYKNETLIFEIVIPLVNSVELTLYHVIPLPVVKNDHYIHIIPEYSYIAISKTHEYYLTLCMNHLMLCRQTNMGTLCPETQPLRLGASELPCEVELFVKPSSIPISCPIHYLDITRSIYHRLKYQNAWIYTIKTTDNVAVSCENRDQAINIQLTGNGVLTLNEDCRGYTPQLVLTPSRHLNSTHYKDLISDVGITTNLTIPASLKQKISSGNTHTNSVIKLTDLGQYSKSIEEIEQLIQEEKDKQNSKNTTDFHSYLFYVILIITAGVLIIKYRHKANQLRSITRNRRQLILSRELNEVTRM